MLEMPVNKEWRLNRSEEKLKEKRKAKIYTKADNKWYGIRLAVYAMKIGMSNSLLAFLHPFVPLGRWVLFHFLNASLSLVNLPPIVVFPFHLCLMFSTLYSDFVLAYIPSVQFPLLSKAVYLHACSQVFYPFLLLFVDGCYYWFLLQFAHNYFISYSLISSCISS